MFGNADDFNDLNNFGSSTNPITKVQTNTFAINEIQLLLAEKRTALAIMRTGIAVIALPLSVFSVLIATSRLYDWQQVWVLFVAVTIINFALVGLGVYLVVRSLIRLHGYDDKIRMLKSDYPFLKQLL